MGHLACGQTLPFTLPEEWEAEEQKKIVNNAHEKSFCTVPNTIQCHVIG